MPPATVVDLQAERVRRFARNDAEIAAWEACTKAYVFAQEQPSLQNMAAAVRAWNAWLTLAMPDEAERRRCLL